MELTCAATTLTICGKRWPKEPEDLGMKPSRAFLGDSVFVCLCTLFAFWVLSLVMAHSAVAQNTAGRVIGSVTDSQGEVVSGAKVIVRNVGTNASWQTATGPDGTYQVLDLPVGDYTLTVEVPGFSKVVTTPQSLNINQSLRIDVTLKLGTVNEVIEVKSAGTQVETVVPTVGGTVTGAPVQDLPLNGRNVLDLALTQPGVTPAEQTPSEGTPIGEFMIAGGRDNAVTYLLDGGDNTSVTYGAPVVNPNPDTIAEFRILTNNYTAEYGRSAGGVVSAVVKSGTNDFHGDVFNYLRNDALNANTYFNKDNPAPTLNHPRPVLKRNQFGGTLGGPIVKDRAFFFFGYQGQRQNSIAVGNLLTVYTPLELQGNFSQSSNGGPDPGVAKFLEANPSFQPNPSLRPLAIIDPRFIDPVAQAYINAGLIPSSSNGIMTPNGNGNDNRDEYTLKIDSNSSGKDRFTLTLDKFHNPQNYPFLPGSDPNVPGFPGENEFNNYFGSVAYTRMFSASTLNEFHLTAQLDNNSLNNPRRQLPGPASFGIAITPDQVTGPAQILLNNSGPQIGFNENGPAHYGDTTYMFADTFTAVRGRHTWKFGGSLGILQNNAVFDYAVDGQFLFYGGTTGNDRADFLLGSPDDFDQYPRGLSAVRSHQYGVFVQDEWHVTSRLVLTIGTRYEYTTPKWDPENRNYMIVPGEQSRRFPNAPLGLVFPRDPGAPSRGVNFPVRDNWAPRFGFAWDPTGKGKTSIRGGGGVFYDVLLAQDNQYQNGTPPFFSAAYFPLGVPGSLSNPYGVAGITNPFPSKPPTSSLDFAAAGFLPFGLASVLINPHLRTPYLYQYNLSVQQQLRGGLLAEVGYVGSSSHKLVAMYDSDPFIVGTLNRPLNRQPGLPALYPQCSTNPWACPFTAMPDTFGNVVNANYNGLLASLTGDIGDWHSLGKTFFTLSYTYSHNIDEAAGFGRNSSFVPAYNPAITRASADSDIRQRLVLSGGWELPFAHAFSKAPKRLTAGWNLYPILIAQTGMPMDVLAGLTYDGVTPGPSGAGDQNVVRPDWAGGKPHALDPHKVQTFTVDGNQITGHFAFDPTGLSIPACYASPLPPGTPQSDACPTATYGTLGRNFFPSPRRVNLDLALEKSTPITERVSLLFRAEFFNALNHTEWQAPLTSMPIGSPQLGQITSTYDPRIGQLALKLTF
jgi:hypothetical protein